MPSAILLTLTGALLGASFASFGGLVLYRLPRGLSVVHPRSACAACAVSIAWHDNVPVASFLMLRGRCRSCRAKIPKSLVVLEAAGALLGAAAVVVALRVLA